MSITKSDTLPRLAKRTADSRFDRIYKYIYVRNKRVELTEKELELKERWDHIWDLLCGKILTDRKAVLAHHEKYPHLDERTCYVDLRNAKKLFGDGKNGTKEQKRAMVNEWLTNLIEKADKAGDYKAAEKLVLRYTRINGLDATENGLAEFIQKQKPVAVIINADPATLEKAAADLMKGVPGVEDIPYEEVEDESA